MSSLLPLSSPLDELRSSDDDFVIVRRSPSPPSSGFGSEDDLSPLVAPITLQDEVYEDIDLRPISPTTVEETPNSQQDVAQKQELLETFMLEYQQDRDSRYTNPNHPDYDYYHNIGRDNNNNNNNPTNISSNSNDTTNNDPSVHVKQLYKGFNVLMFTELTPVSVIEGVGQLEEDLLHVFNVRSLGELAAVASNNALADDLADVLPESMLFVYRAQALLEMSMGNTHKVNTTCVKETKPNKVQEPMEREVGFLPKRIQDIKLESGAAGGVSSNTDNSSTDNNQPIDLSSPASTSVLSTFLRDSDECWNDDETDREVIEAENAIQKNSSRFDYDYEVDSPAARVEKDKKVIRDFFGSLIQKSPVFIPDGTVVPEKKNTVNEPKNATETKNITETKKCSEATASALEEVEAHYLKAEYSEGSVNPDSSIMVLATITPNDLTMLQVHSVYTVRQLCDFASELRKLVVGAEDPRFERIIEEAKKVMKNAEKSTKDFPIKLKLFVYHYVSEAVYQQIKEEKALKSAYVLFSEYMTCDLAQRPFHAWKRVHHSYLQDAAKWMNKKNVDLNTITDADVYSFLVWRAASSFAQFDHTAGPKAIYFSWTEMPKDLRETTLTIDAIIAEDTRSPYADRVSRVLKIDLTQLVNQHNAKIYRVLPMKDNAAKMDSNHWHPTDLIEAHTCITTPKSEIWKHFEPGESDFQSVPHGCVVTNTGTIPFSCIELEQEDDE